MRVVRFAWERGTSSRRGLSGGNPAKAVIGAL